MYKNVIYIDSDETIENLLEKISFSIKFKEKLYIYLTKDSTLFHNINSLKIFDEKVKNAKKDIILISNNFFIFENATKLGFECRNHLDEELYTDYQSITKVKQIGEKKEEEDLFYSIENFKENAKIDDFTEYLSEKSEVLTNVYQLNKKTTFLLIFGSLFLIFTILFLFIPKSKVYISASSEEIKFTENFSFVEKSKNKTFLLDKKKNGIPYKNVKKFYDEKVEIFVTGQIFEGKNAQGKVIVYNGLYEDFGLLKGTRFKTEKGKIFRSTHYQNIRGGKKVKNVHGGKVFKKGKGIINVVADPFDSFGKVVGSNGNIKKGIKFSLPALSQYFQRFITVESIENFKGGTTKTRKALSKEDLSLAKVKIKKKLFKKAKKEIERDIKKINEKTKGENVLFPDKKYLKIEISKIDFSENILGKNMESFTARGRVLVNGISYNKNILIKKLRKNILKKVHPRKKLDFLDFDNLSIRGFDVDEKNDRIKATVGLSGIQKYDLFSDEIYSEKYRIDLKNKISNLSKKSAKKYLEDLKEIGEVKIKIWPPFFNSLPKLEDSIEIIEIKK